MTGSDDPGAGTPTVNELLAHFEWVRRLAHSLVADPVVADDVAQETCLAALRRPPASSASLRAWFRRVASNFAHQHSRREGRRTHRERAAARREGLLSTVELVERAELSRAIVQATLALDEASREVLLLHYFEGLSLRAIASAKEQPLETVRSRHRRAVAALRRTLDAAPGGRSKWLGVALPMALESKAWAVAAAAATTGGALMTAKTKILAVFAITALCVVGVGVGVGVGGGVGGGGEALSEHSTEPSSTRDETASESGSGEPGSAIADALAATTKPERIAVEASPQPAPIGMRSGSLLGLWPNVPWTTNLQIDDHPVKVDAGGRFAFRLAPGRDSIAVRVDDPRYLPFTRAIRLEGDACEIPVEAASVLSGRLRFADRTLVRGGRVSLHAMPTGQPAPQPVIRIATADDGSFYLRTKLAGTAMLVLAASSVEFERDGRHNPARRHSATPKAIVTQAARGTVTKLADILLKDGQEISGHVRLASGAPIAGARIRAGGVDLSGSVEIFAEDLDLRWWPDGTIAPVEFEAETSASGAYRLRGLQSQPYELRLVYFHAKTILHVGNLVRRATAPAFGVNFDLSVSKLRVRVTHRGRPLESAHIGVMRDRLMLKGSSHHGTTNLLLQPGAKYELIVTAEGYRPLRIPHVAGTDDAERVLTMAARRTRMVRVALVGAKELTRVFLDWQPIDANNEDAKRDRRDVTLESGQFAISRVTPGRYRVGVRRPSAPGFRFDSSNCVVDTNLIVEIPEGSRPHDLRIPVRVGGRLLVKVVDRQGSFLAGRCQVFDSNGKRLRTSFTVGDKGGYVRGGASALHPRGVNEAQRVFAPGVYDVQVSVEGATPRREQVTIRRGEVARVSMEIATR